MSKTLRLAKSPRLLQLLILTLPLAGPVVSHATLATNVPRGEKTVQVPVPGRNAERCVIPKHVANGRYTDHDLKDEIKLCGIDENSNAAVCPKTNSTNPGLDLYSLPAGLSPAQVAGAKCKSAGAKKIAKYKLSTSCSYTPSIVGYYHLSRMLGGVADVPPAVLRTYDRLNHIALGHIALAETRPGTLIHETWAALMAQLAAGSRASRRDLLLNDDFTQSYGALSVNPRGESFYPEFFNGGTNNVGRAINFRDRNPTVALLARTDDISGLIGRAFTVENVQRMVQLRDASDLIVIDTLMNQQDRFGNVHYQNTYYYRDAADPGPDDGPKLKSSRKLTPEQVAQLGAVQVKTLLLKDNDCGVSKTNVARQVGLIDRVAHIDPDTYRRLRQFDATADSPTTRDFFLQELLFTSADYTSVRNNLKEVVTKLRQGCAQGRVKLDLDLQAHFSGQPLKPPGCDLQEATVRP
jgi:hypothetical protein